LLLPLILPLACGSSRPGYQTGPTAGDGGAEDVARPPDLVQDGAKETACKNLECQRVTCPGGAKTKLSGTVVAPTPSQYGPPDPIYNAIVYIPNGTVAPFTPGVACDKCGTPVSGDPINITLTNEVGAFELEDVPVGADIPLVIQIGRWRRQVTLPQVDGCKDNKVAADLARLPRSQQEGDIPQMAIVSSVYDPTECIMRKIGVDDAEFTAPTGSGRIHLYHGNGASLPGGSPDGATLWNSPTELARYDIVAFPCSAYPPDAPSRQNVFDYATAGGRVFATDLSYPTVSQGPAPWPGTANWSGATGGGNITATIDTSFPKGDALAKWLKAIGATPTQGQIDLQQTYARFSAVNAPAQRWIYGSATNPQTYSFNTPVGADPKDQCGRVVYSSFHIASTNFGTTFPQECTPGPMTAQERALEFMLFDLSSCVQKDDVPPTVPPK
jgi:hypothetical protein